MHLACIIVRYGVSEKNLYATTKKPNKMFKTKKIMTLLNNATRLGDITRA